MKRTSIYTEGYGHGNPIPAACRVGSMVYSGSILGTDPETGKYGMDVAEQSRLIFSHMESIVRAAGGTPEHIIKVTVWMKDRTQRHLINEAWLKMFPDEQSRPARHTMDAPLTGEKLLEACFVAVID